jgi:hypothetical protein
MGFGSNPFGRGRPTPSGGPSFGGSLAGPGGGGIHFTLRGDKELLKILGEMTTDKQFHRAQQVALSAGGGVMKAAIIANLTSVKDTGLLAKSVKVVLRPPKYKNSRMATVGPTHMHVMMRRTKKGALRRVSEKKVSHWESQGEKLIPYDPANYGHLVERGTKAHSIGPETMKAIRIYGGHPIKGSVWHPGTTSVGFMRQAVDSQGRRAQARVAEKLREAIEHYVRSRKNWK